MSRIEDPVAQLRKLGLRATGFFCHLLGKLPIPRSLRLPGKSTTATVAVDLGQSHVLLLAVEEGMGKPEITHFRFETRAESLDAVSERLKILLEEESLGTRNIRVAMKGQGVVVRILTFPQMKREEFASAITYEIEKYIPFKANEVILDFQILNENISKGPMQVMETLLVAAKRSEIYSFLKIFKMAGMDVKTINLSAFAIANLLEYVTPGGRESVYGFLDMGTETTALGVLMRGKPVFMREIAFGGGDLLKLLKRKPGVVEGPFKESSEYPEVVEQAVESFLTELKISLGYYTSHVAGSEPIEKLFVTGGGFRLIPDLGILEKEIKVPVTRPDLFSKIGIRPGVDEALLRKNEDVLAVALGLCLSP